MRRRQAAVPRGVGHATPIFAARAEGALLEDVDGNRFLDFAGGIGVQNVGHRARGVVAAIREQLDAFIHTCFSVAPSLRARASMAAIVLARSRVLNE